MAVEFSEEEAFNKSFTAGPAETSALNKFFIKIGLASNEESSKIVMIVITIICFALAYYFFTRQ